jgi:hypothetical protein
MATLVCGGMGSIKMAGNTKYRIRVWFMVFNTTFTTDITKEGLHYINAGNRKKTDSLNQQNGLLICIAPLQEKLCS